MTDRTNQNEFIIDKSLVNKRIDYCLKKKIPSLSYPVICKIIRKGQVKVNKKKTSNSYLVKEGDLVNLYIRILEKKNQKLISIDPKLIENVKSWIIFEDKNILVFNKPSGFAVQGGSRVKISLDALLGHFKSENLVRPKLVHRIDKKTSGLIIVARNLEYAQNLGQQFKSRKIKKEYLLLINGCPRITNGFINTPIILNNKRLDSLTYYSVLKTKNNISLVIAYPYTGRKNQLRKHFAFLGYPILGEERFYVKSSEKIYNKYFFLHSFFMSFQYKNKEISFFASLPNYFLKEINNMNLSVDNLMKKKQFVNLDSFKELRN